MPEPAAPRILLVAPNVSRNMGGEALKALQIFQELRAKGLEVRQLAHARVKAELDRDFPDLPVSYITDDRLQVLLDRLGASWLLTLLNAWQLSRAARRVARETGAWLVHFTAPISPVLPYFRMPGMPLVIGPLNGSIYHPPAFARRETRGKRLGKLILAPLQKILGAMAGGKRDALVLVAGGTRTAHALRLGGCRPERLFDSLDSGVPRRLSATARVTHHGHNVRFVFAGRLIRYKGCDLAIRALALTADATLDVIGDGDERGALESLASELGIIDRVRFRGWMPGGEPLYESLRSYRGFVLPSLAEANGIAVQEAMTIGVPVVCLDWGGPALLLDDASGILIAPGSEEQVVAELAAAMTRLTNDAGFAEQLSVAARRLAEQRGYSWDVIIEDWIKVYDRALAELGDRSIAGWRAASEQQLQSGLGNAPADDRADSSGRQERELEA